MTSLAAGDATARAHAAAPLADAVGLLARAIEGRDAVSGDHVERMADYCAAIAAGCGWPEHDIPRLRVAAMLHDVGTLVVPDRLLLKGGVLSEHELWVMQGHCQAGHDILSASDDPTLQLAASIALTHHEWFDGTGYPRSLRRDDIPLEGRIAAIADVYDALTSDRPYREALDDEEARHILNRERGSHFDPELLDVFLAVVPSAVR